MLELWYEYGEPMGDTLYEGDELGMDPEQCAGYPKFWAGNSI